MGHLLLSTFAMMNILLELIAQVLMEEYAVKLKDIKDIEFIIGLSLHRLRSRASTGAADELTSIWTIAAGAIDEGLVVDEKLGIVETDVRSLDDSRKVRAGDIVMKTTAPFTCAFITEEPDKPLYTASSCITIRLPLTAESASYHPAFLAAYLNLPFMQDTLQAKTTGTNTSVIKKAILEELEVPEMDYAEQKQLGEAYVAIVEASAAHLQAFACLRETHAALFAESLSISLGGSQ